MQKKCYLVDTENVGTKWMIILPELEADDKVMLFYTDASGKYSLGEIQDLVQYGAHISYVRCFNGHANALDFQLSATVGYLGHEDSDCEYVIVSDDGGYDEMIRFMRGVGVNASRLPMRISTNVVKQSDIVHTNHHIEEKIEERVSGNKPNNRNVFAPEKIAKILGTSTTDKKIFWIAEMMEDVKHQKVKNSRVTRSCMVNNNLQKQYGPAGQTYYKKLKDSGILKRLDA